MNCSLANSIPTARQPNGYIALTLSSALGDGFWLETSTGEVISTLRLMEEHPGGHKGFRIGRVCTKREARGHGHSTRLLQAALAEVGDFPCRIDAQTYLADMYARLGFVRDGEEFMQDGIPHVPMLKP